MPLEGISGGSWPKGLTFTRFGDLLDARRRIVDDLFAHHVVVIRGLGELGAEHLMAVASLIGQPEIPIASAQRLSRHPFVELVSRTGTEPEYATPAAEPRLGVRIPSSFYWHSDRSFLREPSLATVAYLHRAPEMGGDLQFINLVRAVAALSLEQRELLNDLVGTHSYARYWLQLAGVEHNDQAIAGAMRLYPDVMHPLMPVHPITRLTLPYISPLTLRAVSTMVHRAEVDAALAVLLATCTDAFTDIHLFQHDLVLWDNYGALHRGTPSVGPRELWRITVATR